MNKPYVTQLTMNSHNINSHFYCDSKYNHTKTPAYVAKRQRIHTSTAYDIYTLESVFAQLFLVKLTTH